MTWQDIPHNIYRKLYHQTRHTFQALKIGLVPSTILMSLILGARWLGALQTMELALFDTLMRLAPPEPTDPRIAIITIDEPTIRAANNYPLSDRQLLELLEKIKAQNPHSIALDLFRDLPIAPGTAEFQQFVATQDNVFAIKKVLPEIVDPPLGFPTERVGFTDAYLDLDGTQRRTIFATLSNPPGFQLSLVILLAQDYLAQYNITLDSAEHDPATMQFNQTEIPRFQGRTGGYTQKFQMGVVENLINFRRGRKPFDYYSAQTIFNGEIPTAALENRIVFIGLANPSIADYVNAPIASSIHPEQKLIYGVEIQAHTLSQILSAVLEKRPLLKSPNEALEYLWILTWGIGGLLLAGLGKSPFKAILTTSLAGLMLIGICYIFFLWGWWLPLVPSILLLIVNGYGLIAFYEYDRNQQLRIHLQEQAIALLEVNNEILESKVTQRTAELQQAKEFAEASSLAKSQFLAHVTHELRTPLNSILGFSQLLSSEQKIQAKNKERVEMIHRSGTHLLTLINNILDLAKVESGKQTLKLESFLITDIIQTLEAIFRLRIEQKGLQFSCEFSHNCHDRWMGDRQKLEQILINLVGNALKFTNQGSITVRIEQEQDQLNFAVIDTGIGIHADELKKLFIAFEQTASGKELGKGTGLGLAISAQLVQFMGGELQVKSELNQGTTFFFIIVLESSKDSQQIRETHQQKYQQEKITPKNNLATPEALKQYFQAMEEDWQIAMGQAITTLNGKKINILIEQLTDEHRIFKARLKELSNNYAFDELEKLCHSSKING